MSTTIPARHGAHIHLKSGQRIRVFNPSGHQVVDFWAFPKSTVPAWMSMAQSRSKLMKIMPAVNDTLIDSRRQNIMTLIEDTTPGIHDMIFPPCDAFRYTELGVEGHASCGDNLRTELGSVVSELNESDPSSPLIELERTIRTWEWSSEPLNLFMNVPYGALDTPERGHINITRPVCNAGDYVVLKAEVDCLVVMSACPSDLMDTNARNPGDAAYEVH